MKNILALIGLFSIIMFFLGKCDTKMDDVKELSSKAQNIGEYFMEMGEEKLMELSNEELKNLKNKVDSLDYYIKELEKIKKR